MSAKNDGVVSFGQGNDEFKIVEKGDTTLNRSDLLTVGADLSNNFQRDRNGNIVEDSSGNPVVKRTSLSFSPEMNGGVTTQISIKSQFSSSASGRDFIEGEAVIREPSGEVRRGAFTLAREP